MYVCVCVRACMHSVGRQIYCVYVCVCVCVVCALVCLHSVSCQIHCVSICVCESESERDREKEFVYSVGRCVHVCVSMRVCVSVCKCV